MVVIADRSINVMAGHSANVMAGRIDVVARRINVMAGLDPATHDVPDSGRWATCPRYPTAPKLRHRVDGRIKSGHDKAGAGHDEKSLRPAH